MDATFYAHEGQTIRKSKFHSFFISCLPLKYLRKQVGIAIYTNLISDQIRHAASGLCLEKPTGKSFHNQPTGVASVSECSSNLDLFQMFVLTRYAAENSAVSIATDESVCLDVVKEADARNKLKVFFSACVNSNKQKWIYNSDVSVNFISTRYELRNYTCIKRVFNLTRNDFFFQELFIKHQSTNLCVEIAQNERYLILTNCTRNLNQKWNLQLIPWK